MFRNRVIALLVLWISAAGVVSAEEQSVQVAQKTVQQAQISDLNKAKLKAMLTQNLGLDIASIKSSPLKGIVELVTNQGLFYASADGKFLLQGKLFGIQDGVTNYTEESLAQVRIDGMAKFSNDMITYPAKDEKHVVTVFTDITCGYCRKMHGKMADYNDKGITVRYLAYPRSGVIDRSGQQSQGFKDLRSIWCNENPQEALTKAKQGANVAEKICDKPIKAEFDFGRQVGVTGTPAIILNNGMMIPGYQEPDALINILNQINSAG